MNQTKKETQEEREQRFKQRNAARREARKKEEAESEPQGDGESGPQAGGKERKAPEKVYRWPDWVRERAGELHLLWGNEWAIIAQYLEAECRKEMKNSGPEAGTVSEWRAGGRSECPVFAQGLSNAKEAKSEEKAREEGHACAFLKEQRDKTTALLPIEIEKTLEDMDGLKRTSKEYAAGWDMIERLQAKIISPVGPPHLQSELAAASQDEAEDTGVWID